MKEWVFNVIGIIATLAISIGVFLICLAYFLEVVENKYRHYKAGIYEECLRGHGRRLVGESYWFNEDPLTMSLLMRIGEDLRDHANIDIENIRSFWRHRRALLEADKEEIDASYTVDGKKVEA